MNKATLIEAQALMTTILRDIDKVCRENNISYWIESGTLLGAVRHGGFIPWDDDIDIGMLREDYNKFVEIAKDKLPKDLFVQNIENEKSVIYGWTKVRHKNSCIVEIYKDKYHTGMFVDIFPYDYCNDDTKNELFEKKNAFAKQYSFLYYSGFKFGKNILDNCKVMISRIYKTLVLRKDMNDLFREIKSEVSEFRRRKETDSIAYGLEVFGFKYDMAFKLDNIFPLKRIRFEDIEVNGPNNVEAILKGFYGNTYMQLPPEKDRHYHYEGLFIEESRK